MKTYYSVIIRDDVHSPWGVHSGDFDREVMQDEMADLSDQGFKRSQFKMIQTTADQADIDETIRHLNAQV